MSSLAALPASTKACERGVRLLVGAAEAHHGELLVCLMTPGRGDHGGDIGGAADRAVGAEDRRDALDAVDAVLQGDERACPARPAAVASFGGLLGVPQLDREQHDVDRPDARRGRR